MAEGRTNPASRYHAEDRQHELVDIGIGIGIANAQVVTCAPAPAVGRLNASRRPAVTCSSPVTSILSSN